MSKKQDLEKLLIDALKEEGDIPPWQNYPATSNATPFRGLLKGKGSGMQIDIYWPEYKLGIEVNGSQWVQNTGHNSGLGIERDARKKNYCLLYGIKLLTFVTDHIEKQMQQYTLPTIRQALLLVGAPITDWTQEIENLFSGDAELE